MNIELFTKINGITRALILKAADQTGFVRINSCCDIKDKMCSMDQWTGNLEGFANALLRLIVEKINE